MRINQIIKGESHRFTAHIKTRSEDGKLYTYTSLSQVGNCIMQFINDNGVAVIEKTLINHPSEVTINHGSVSVAVTGTDTASVALLSSQGDLLRMRLAVVVAGETHYIRFGDKEYETIILKEAAA